MKNILALIGLFVVLVGGLGWYLNWFQVKVQKSVDGNYRVETEIDAKKAFTDVGDGTKKVGDLIGQKAESAITTEVPPTAASTPAPAVNSGGWTFGRASSK